MMRRICFVRSRRDQVCALLFRFRNEPVFDVLRQHAHDGTISVRHCQLGPVDDALFIDNRKSPNGALVDKLNRLTAAIRLGRKGI
jgi:hypothetical protein